MCRVVVARLARSADSRPDSSQSDARQHYAPCTLFVSGSSPWPPSFVQITQRQIYVIYICDESFWWVLEPGCTIFDWHVHCACATYSSHTASTQRLSAEVQGTNSATHGGGSTSVQRTYTTKMRAHKKRKRSACRGEHPYPGWRRHFNVDNIIEFQISSFN